MAQRAKLNENDASKGTVIGSKQKMEYKFGYQKRSLVTIIVNLRKVDGHP